MNQQQADVPGIGGNGLRIFNERERELIEPFHQSRQ